MISSATAHPLPIFVYGTLMMGQPNDHMWQDAVHDYAAALAGSGCLYDVGYYPIMIEKPGSKVLGQIFWLKKGRFAQIIQSLDFLEGFDPEHPQVSDFRRVKMEVTTLSGSNVVAWTYVGNTGRVQDLPVVEDGDWAKHAAAKRGSVIAWWQEFGTVLDETPRPGDSER